MVLAGNPFNRVVVVGCRGRFRRVTRSIVWWVWFVAVGFGGERVQSCGRGLSRSFLAGNPFDRVVVVVVCRGRFRQVTRSIVWWSWVVVGGSGG